MSAPEELTCQELVELVTAYLEGALPAHERARFDRHLQRCSGCQMYLDQMRRTIHLIGTLSEDDLTPEARTQLLNVFRRWRQR